MTFSACAYALKCLVDPDLPVNDGFYRLVRLDAPGGHGRELHLAVRRRRRLGDADAPRRGDLPRPPARVPGAAPGGHEGDDVPGWLRHASTSRRAATPASTTRSQAGTAAASRATAPTRCRPTVRTPRTRRSRRPSSTTPSASTDARVSSRTPTDRAASAAGSGCARTTASTRPTTFTILADRDRQGPWGALGGRSAQDRRVHADQRMAARPGSARSARSSSCPAT